MTSTVDETLMATSGAKKFSGSLSKLARDIDEIRRDSHGLKEYDKLCFEHSVLKRELQEKNQVIEKRNQAVTDLCKQKDSQIDSMQAKVDQLRTDENVMTRKYQEQFKTWEADIQRHSKETEMISKLQKDLQYWSQRAETAEQAKGQFRSQVGENSKQIEDHQKAIDRLQRDLKMSELMAEKLLTEREDDQKQLAKAVSENGILPIDQSQIVNKFTILASRSEELVRAIFFKESPKPETYIDVSSSPSSRIPQITSNSEAALWMRCALAEAIIAEQLSTHIFKDFYIPASSGYDSHGISKVLSWLDDKHPRKASIARCQIAMAFDDPREKEALIGRATESACHSLNPWIHERTVQERLREDLVMLFKVAMDLWQQLQRASRHTIAIASVASGQWNVLEDARGQYDKATVEEQYKSHEAAFESATPTAVLFPQICIGNEVLFHGWALFPSQSAVIAASIENRSKSLSGKYVKRLRKNGNRIGHVPNQSPSENTASNT